jgi:hypothetical protein
LAAGVSSMSKSLAGRHGVTGAGTTSRCAIVISWYMLILRPVGRLSHTNWPFRGSKAYGLMHHVYVYVALVCSGDDAFLLTELELSKAKRQFASLERRLDDERADFRYTRQGTHTRHTHKLHTQGTQTKHTETPAIHGHIKPLAPTRGLAESGVWMCAARTTVV